MFILRNRISAFIDDLRVDAFLTSRELIELQDHLTTEAENLVTRGMSDADAFSDAARRLGTLDELRTEFQAEHDLSQRPHAGWIYVLDGVMYRFTRYVQMAAVLLLPIVGLIAPLLLLTGKWGGVYDELLPGEPLPAITNSIFFLAETFITHWWLVLPLLLGMLYPTLRTGIRLYVRGEFTVAELLKREYALVNGLWPWILVLYPLIGFPVVAACLAPFIKLIDKLGG